MAGHYGCRQLRGRLDCVLLHRRSPTIAAGARGPHVPLRRSPGYDGQFYRLVAHDPWLRKGYARYMDNANLRYRRILQPALAWTLALGDPRRIDQSYFARPALCCFGHRMDGDVAPRLWILPCLVSVVPCSARRPDLHRPHDCGPCALRLPCRRALVRRPATMGLAAGCCRTGRAGPRPWFLVALATAAHSLFHRRWGRAALFLAALLPALAWYAWLQSATAVPGPAPLIPTWAVYQPLAGHFQALLHPAAGVADPALRAITEWFDRLVILSLFGCTLLLLGQARRWPPSWLWWLASGFAAVFVLVGNPWFWKDPHSFLRATPRWRRSWHSRARSFALR